MANGDIKYKRILLKISGEALAGEVKNGVEDSAVRKICEVIKNVTEMGVQVGVVIGGGNFWRGRTGGEMDRARADHMGMLATVMNSIALQDGLRQVGVEARVMTAIEIVEVAEPYNIEKAIRHLEKGRVVIIGGGTGAPFFSTDTAAALRAAEIKADALMMMKNIGYIYTDDPKKNPDAQKIYEITYDEILAKKLSVIDFTATSFCMDRKIPIVIFGMEAPDKIADAIRGENIGTIVKEA